MSSTDWRSWEYRAEESPGIEKLNELGAVGWELAGIDQSTYVLKRPALTFKERVTMEQRERYFASRAAKLRPESDQ